MCVGRGLTLAATQPTIAQTAPDCPTQPLPPPLRSNDALDRRKERGGNIVLATRRQKEPRGHRKDDSVP